MPSNGLADVGENNPNPKAAVIKLSVVNTAAAVATPARIAPHYKFLPASIGLVACS